MKTYTLTEKTLDRRAIELASIVFQPNKMVLTKERAAAVRKLCTAFDTNKSFFLTGDTGTGKTIYTRLFLAAQPEKQFTFYNMRHLFREYAAMKNPDEFILAFIHKTKYGHLILDDVGADEAVGAFGRQNTILYDIIESRMDSKFITGIISNNTLSQILARFGTDGQPDARLMSRFKKWETIIMPGDDLRGEVEVMPLAEWPKVILPAEPEEQGVPCPDHLRAEIYEKLGIIANRVVEAPPSKADEMRNAFWGDIKRPQ
jgi:DNA replication protein DnaC